jgi:hypothetical protein
MSITHPTPQLAVRGAFLPCGGWPCSWLFPVGKTPVPGLILRAACEPHEAASSCRSTPTLSKPTKSALPVPQGTTVRINYLCLLCTYLSLHLPLHLPLPPPPSPSSRPGESCFLAMPTPVIASPRGWGSRPGGAGVLGACVGSPPGRWGLPELSRAAPLTPPPTPPHRSPPRLLCSSLPTSAYICLLSAELLSFAYW